MTACFLIALLAPSFAPAATTWSGDFTITIKGQGKATGPGPSNGKWDISRECRGKIVFDRTFAGAGIAGTTDSRNTSRYEAWISDIKQPIEMRMHDTITVRGPLFAVNQIRFDTFRYNCPEDPKSEAWQSGKVGSPILQFDYVKGTFEFETPRFFATTKAFFQREFVAGPKSWTSKKPIVEDKSELEFEIIHGLSQPRDWFKISGPFNRDQKEIVINRKFAFGPVLGASILNQKVYAEFKLTLKRTLGASQNLVMRP